MNKEELKLRLGELFPSAAFNETGEWVTLDVNAEDGKSIARRLRHTAGLDFDYLFCLTCVDWKTHFTMVYHLSSTLHRHSLVIKIKLDRDQPEIETVSDIWLTAEFHEREVYDLFGVRFVDHPDLRRLFLTEDWVGWPLRKDYEDPVNMIKL
jgi:NADH-quinone oxidoreductase subunit C